MKHKLLLLYSWFIRTFFYFWPDIPLFMRWRGFFYGLGMKHCGKDFQVTHSAILNTLEEFDVGKRVYIANNCSLIANGRIIIGDYTLFGPGVVVSSGNHLFDGDKFVKVSNKKDVIILKNCWIGANCTICAGAKLPEHSLLAAGSVLTTKTDKTDEYGLYGGTPARFIKSLKTE